MNRVLFLFVLLVSCSFAFPKAKRTAPEWVVNFKSVYPSSKYIGYVSSARTEDEAKEKSLGLISNYFNTSIQSVSRSNSVLIETGLDGNSSWYKKNTMNRTITVKSDANLFGVEYSFYFSEGENLHYCAAFIDRTICAQLILQRMEKTKKNFTDFYMLGQRSENNDCMTAMRYYAKASSFASDYLSLAEYISLIAPEMKISKDDVEKMAGVSSRISQLAQSSSISVYATGDSNAVLKTTVENLFLNEGFVLKDFGETTGYLMRIEIERNIVADGEVFITTPRMTVVISNADGNVFSYRKTFERFKAFKESTLHKHIETKLSDELKKSLIKEFYENI